VVGEVALNAWRSLSLGLFVRVGFVCSEFAGDAVTGGGRGC
jgi:hypothetical protein